MFDFKFLNDPTRIVTGFLFLMFASNAVSSQESNLQFQKKDSSSVLSAFRNGKTSGQFRYVFMKTNNQPGLTDYFANAAGGGIKFETARYKNFQLGLSGFFTYNISSSDLTKADTLTNQMNRYEAGLFDLEDLSNKTNIYRLEEFYFKYYFKKSTIIFGKQLLSTPFINQQDGRMRPTAVEGFFGEFNQFKKTKIELGYIYNISPRSTTSWYKLSSSIGKYPVGVDMYGEKSGYAGNLKSKGVFLTGISYELNKQFKIKFWNQFTENIFNTALIQADYEKNITDQSILFSSIQLIRQDAVNNGGNKDPLKSYIQKGSKAWTISTRTGWKNKNWETKLNYTRITRDGQYLMPREWGRDPFFTFLSRERNEGLGNVHALMGDIQYKIPAIRLKTSVSYGIYKLPALTDFLMNKYGMPSYNQLNIDIKYKFSGFLNGLETNLLFIYKDKIGRDVVNEKFIFNKVNMSLWNFAVNYQF